MSDQSRRLTWIDLAVYAPVGVVCTVCEALPRLADAARERIAHEAQLARMMGKIAVKQGRRELNRRLDELAEQRRLELAGAAVGPDDDGARPVEQVDTDSALDAEAPETVVSTPTVSTVLAPPPDGSHPAVVAPLAADLAISDYDSLAASQVVARLAALSPEDLAAVEAYESAHRGRRTILGKVHQLRAG